MCLPQRCSRANETSGVDEGTWAAACEDGNRLWHRAHWTLLVSVSSVFEGARHRDCRREPRHVNKSKEIEDNSQTKSDYKDAKVDENRKGVIETIFDLYVNQGMGTTKVAQQLNEQGILNRDGRKWNQLKVSRILKNQIYIGNLVYNKGSFKHIRDYESDVVGKKKTIREMNSEDDWIIVEGCHESIIDKEVFEMAQKKLKKHAKKSTPRNARHPLTGVIYCGKCGKAMNVMKRTAKYGKYRYYMCSSVIHYGRQSCDQPNINADKLERMVLLELKDRLISIRENARFWDKYSIVDAGTKALQKQLREVDKKLEKNAKDTADLYFEREDMPTEAYKMIQQRFKDDAVSLKDRKRDIEKELNNAVDGAVRVEELRQAIDEFFEMSHDENDKDQLRGTFQSFIEKMVVTDKSVQIESKVDGYTNVVGEDSYKQ